MRIAFCHVPSDRLGLQPHRTPPLALWRPLWALGGEWISVRKLGHKWAWRADEALSKDVIPHDNDLTDLPPNVRDASEDLVDLADTVALMRSCDLTITVDTVVANLGEPCWVLLPYPSEKRWGLQARSPWFPEHRLFRQPALGDWGSVFSGLYHALMDLGIRKEAA